jgi:hypothetical protein
MSQQHQQQQQNRSQPQPQQVASGGGNQQPSNGSNASKKKTNPMFHLVAGGCAGFVESSVCHPLDTIKTRYDGDDDDSL